MIKQVYANLEKTRENDAWFNEAMKAAIKEYKNVWTKEPRLVTEIGLSRYFCEGIG